MSVSMRDIDPTAVYSFREAAHLLPSAREGKRLHVRTLERWREAGLVKAFRRGKTWFVHGSELLRLLAADQIEPWEGRTPAERKREVEAAEAELKRLGVL